MPNSRPSSLSNLMTQIELNKFYEHPVARVSFGLILSIICVLFFAIFAIKPTLETMAQLLKQIDEKKIVDQKLDLKILALGTARQNLSAAADTVKVLDVAVPSTPHFTQLLVVVEKLAVENNVSILSLSTPNIPLESTSSARLANPVVSSISFTLNLKGTYEDLVAFLRRLQNVQRIIVVDRFDISPQPQDQATGTTTSLLQLRVDGRTFTFAPPQASPVGKAQ